MSISYLSTEFREYRNHHDLLHPKYSVEFELVVDSYEEYKQLVEYVQKFNSRNCTVESVETAQSPVPGVSENSHRNIAEIFKQTLLQEKDEQQVPLFKPENIITYAPVKTEVTPASQPAVPEPAPVVEVPTPPPAKVQVSAEVESPKLVNDVLFLFEEDCKKIVDMPSAIKVWKDHAGAIKKLAEPDKSRGSNTLALRLAEVLNVEPEEAKELFRAAMSGKKAEAAQPSPAPVEAPPAPVAAPVAAAASEAGNAVLDALAAESKPILGLAVKHACTQLKTEQGVSAKMVEDLLVSLIGKHPALNVTPEDIYKITRQSTMKLYAGAAKTKLLDK